MMENGVDYVGNDEEVFDNSRRSMDMDLVDKGNDSDNSILGPFLFK
jgi:hypothetical protein